jgi:TPR repeat protein
MPLSLTKPLRATGLALTALLTAGLACPALADVEAGIGAWGRGEYAAAVREWQAPAAAGDPDAMFNLAQAYRLGRGVPVDTARAETLYIRAAAAGNLQAADTYGLMLFENGRREDAVPYLRPSARRGDPRAQYLLGIAHFNGDIVERDWPRAYALMTLANAAGLPQAAPALAEMDRAIPLAQRQQAAGLAQQMKAEAEAARNAQVGAFNLAGPAADGVQPPSALATTPPASRPAPPIASARTAVAEAGHATGTISPEEAGASYTLASSAERPSVPLAATTPIPAPIPPPAAPAPPVAASEGNWRVQLGAFSVVSNAEALWDRVAGRAELAGARRITVPTGRVTRLQAGGFPTRSAAQDACAALKRAGYDCLVIDH